MGWLEMLAEEKIKQALARDASWGASPYAGQRVRLGAENPYVPKEWWAAFHLLRTHDLLPPWLQRGHWIRQARTAWRRSLQTVLLAYRPTHPARPRALARLQREAATLNAHIRDYNLSRPWGSAPLPPLDWEAELAAARRAIGEEEP